MELIDKIKDKFFKYFFGELFRNTTFIEDVKNKYKEIKRKQILEEQPWRSLPEIPKEDPEQPIIDFEESWSEDLKQEEIDEELNDFDIKRSKLEKKK